MDIILLQDIDKVGEMYKMVCTMGMVNTLDQMAIRFLVCGKKEH
jgi:hypothetical protein